jgi:hypothetical protein
MKINSHQNGLNYKSALSFQIFFLYLKVKMMMRSTIGLGSTFILAMFIKNIFVPIFFISLHMQHIRKNFTLTFCFPKSTNSDLNCSRL